MRLYALLVCAVSLAACGGRDPVANGANDTDGLPAINEAAPDATGAPPRNDAETVNASASTAPRSGKIPAALRGRWGLSPRDCTSALGDAKGLLVVNSEELRFYESRAVPAAGVETAPERISGAFDFTGEGQSWSKFQALQLQQGNLVRTESNPTASFTYVKCT